jgi:serine/threonine protein kinase
MSSAVPHLHGSRRKHLNLKPANILLQVTKDGVTPVISAFGTTKVFEAHLKITTSSEAFYYISPKQAELEKVGRPADVFSLGAVFLELGMLLYGVKRFLKLTLARK